MKIKIYSEKGEEGGCTAVVALNKKENAYITAEECHCQGKYTPSEGAENQITAGTCCRMCDYCPGFVSTSSSDYYTCYNCKHHKDHHFC